LIKKGSIISGTNKMTNGKKLQVPPMGRQSGYKFLIVDDDNPMLFIISEVLMASFENSIAYTANTNSQAIDLAIERSPDLITSDIIRPGGDGIEFIRILRSHEKTKNIPVFAISGILAVGRSKDGTLSAHAKATETMCYDAGFNKIIPKPLILKQFIEDVKMQLDIDSGRL
jgi:CheY-like chemotaxis protein